MKADRLPEDLPGGWDHRAEFSPAPLQPGQVWRKSGPVDALKILRVMLPGHDDHDGGAPGISVLPSVVVRGGRVRWSSRSWFRLGDELEIHTFMKEHGYSLTN